MAKTAALEAKIQEWLSWDKNDATRSEIASLQEAGDWARLSSLLEKRMAFGTAGLRGRMGAGYACMNDLVIVQTTQGLADYLLKTVPNAAQRGVVVGYDGRYHSRRFAELTASIFLHLGVKVWLFAKICPTPWVAFGTRYYKAAAGIMVTASHNPKQDNGYKVYWDNGAQIIPPHDSGIQSAIQALLEPRATSWDTSVIGGATDPGPELTPAYMERLSAAMRQPQLNADSPIRFTVTSMHGVSHPYMCEAFKACNFKPFIPVREQMEADPEFPTVPFPNPEEGKSALNLAMATADAGGSTVILANDPDADRLAVAEKQPSGEWRVFNGNETGALLGWWCWSSYPSPDDKDTCYMLASTVSSKILRSIAEKEGFHFEETLTGFKWMGNRAEQLMLQGKKVLFAFEEAIGFMCGTTVLDKDGVSAALEVAQMATTLANKGLSLTQQLDLIYDRYGFHTTNNSYYLCHEPEVVKRMFERIRSLGGAPGKYPTSLGGGQYRIGAVRDLTTGHDSGQPDGRAILPVSSSSQMITFTFSEPQAVLTLRTSGTEPKIKWYSEIRAQPGQT
ncbi:phosphoglucomutase-2-like [Amphibalanus amphitrite]|uniref:phosphoglucomutase-2-like n=1 Tax=Amphibalanus amphitrite TaxID=1232801 RepID=UPI001C90A633|nr:phosphoglucomutase-2-like [Amphibalanus amphitrite]XP_043190191.1 phosphoglucomutase-2-like [Amphibalanus amphitrite]XP_043190193.1 phosphoglucomutase-2-like [Amphibalanus amphitrite]